MLYSHAPPFLLLQVEIPAIRCYNKGIIFGKDSGKGKDMGYILKTAQYVNDFQCIGGKCTMDCCRGWTILWTDEEVETLKNSKHSDELDEIINKSFEKMEDYKNRIVLLPDGDCPFHDKKDKLCKIQKELGAEYLSSVCRNYPIRGTVNNHIITRVRYLSCPAVFDLVTNDEKACDIYIYGKEYEPESLRVYLNDTFDMTEKNPALKYRNELFDFFYGILSDKKRDIHTSLIVGTLAAQTLSKLETSTPDRIPDGISSLSKQINSPALAKSLSDIEPNYFVKLGVVQCLLDNTSVGKKIEPILSALRTKDENNKSSVDVLLYIDSLRKFNKTFEDKPYIIKNVVRCLFLCIHMPFASLEHDLFGNYAFFCAVAALIDFLAAASAAGTDDKKEMLERFKTAVCLASHPLCHNSGRTTDIVNYLKEVNCYSAGHLALIVK